jgi:superfamily I DNA and/or RNA helicase
LKNAVLIGGTVVGVANRLLALRASEPFAIIVEEACEVMEPTLMAVLSVPSVQKIQLIGDHRQLPAFVSNCWYDVANKSPALKISLFERLVHEQAGICSVLDVQRRMRPEISYLTKGHYSDVVEIKDHSCTVTQRI